MTVKLLYGLPDHLTGKIIVDTKGLLLYLCTENLLTHHKYKILGLTGFDSKLSGCVSMPSLAMMLDNLDREQ